MTTTSGTISKVFFTSLFLWITLSPSIASSPWHLLWFRLVCNCCIMIQIKYFLSMHLQLVHFASHRWLSLLINDLLMTYLKLIWTGESLLCHHCHASQGFMHRARPCPVTYQRVSLTVLQKREEKKNFEVVSIMIVLAQHIAHWP